PATGKELPGWPAHTSPLVGVRPHPGIRPGNEPVVADVAVGDLNGDGKQEVVVTSTTGNVYVFDDHGLLQPGWPIPLAKGATPPAIGFLQGQSGGADIVMRPQYTEEPSNNNANLTPGGVGFVFAYGADGSVLPGFPVRMPSVVEYYGSAQEFVTEGSSAPVTADVTGSGSGPDMIGVAPVLSPPDLIDGAG